MKFLNVLSLRNILLLNDQFSTFVIAHSVCLCICQCPVEMNVSPIDMYQLPRGMT
jgi:hypothetical protein